MTLQFLVVSHDMTVETLFRRGIAEVGGKVEFCPDLRSGLAALEFKRFDVIVADCDDVYEGVYLLKATRNSRPNRSSPVIAITNGQTNAADANDLGANYVIAKPLSPDGVVFELHKTCQVLSADQRNSQRFAITVPVFMSFGEVLDRRALTFNVSRGGLGVHINQTIENDELLRVRFWLPDCAAAIQAHGEIAWLDRDGKVGIKFVSMSRDSQDLLKRWLECAAFTGETRPGCPDLVFPQLRTSYGYF